MTVFIMKNPYVVHIDQPEKNILELVEYSLLIYFN